jgi:SnoaL-like domain
MKPEIGLRAMYEAFRVRDINAVLRQMTVDVDWRNACDGGRVHGHDGARQYWTRQWSAIDPTVKPIGLTPRPDGTITVEVLGRACGEVRERTAPARTVVA